MKITKKELPLVLHGAVVVALFCLLLASVAILMNKSVAWFSHNKNVKADGASVALRELGVEADYYVKDANGNKTDIEEVGDWRHIFQDIAPGDTVTIGATYTSLDSADHKLKVYFKAHTEEPITKEVKDENGAVVQAYYYFGSQLKVLNANKVVSDTETQTTAVNKYLVEPPENQIYYTAETTPNEITLTETEFKISQGSPATWEFTVQFVNYLDIDQNDYQGFGNETVGGKCWWQLVAVLEDS